AFASVARMPPTTSWPVVTETLVILPEVATIEMPRFGLAFLVPLAGVMVTWATGEADGLPPAPAWRAALDPAGLVQAATNKETIPNTAMTPTPSRRLVGRLR